MSDFFKTLYFRLTLERPLFVGMLVVLFLLFSAYFAQDFKLDASADSLVLENDQDLRYYRAIRARYGSDDFLVVTYSPQDDLFSEHVLADLKSLRDELGGLERVESVT